MEEKGDGYRMEKNLVRIALAQTRFPKSLVDGEDLIARGISQAADQGSAIVCFPEAVLPGLRGVGFDVEPYDHEAMQAVLKRICELAASRRIAVVLPTEWRGEGGMELAAFVISADGELLGRQTKNQLDPDEEPFGYNPGVGRTLFEIEGLKFGIVICHEGWRYPETVRWAARRGADIVFHPQFTPAVPNPEFYIGAMACRSGENQIYFASVNFALKGQQVVTSLISPAGETLASASPEVDELIVYDIDPAQATRRLAGRLRPELLG